MEFKEDLDMVDEPIRYTLLYACCDPVPTRRARG